jgi:type 2 lantibiotic biosynthesis protein LanM
MEILGLDDPVWFDALTLGERAASLRAAGAGAMAVGPADSEVAENRLQRWRSAPPFADQSQFEKRLAVDLIDERQFRLLLAEPAENLRNRIAESPAWLERIRLAFTRPAATRRIGSKGKASDRLQKTGFLAGLEPLVKLGLDRLQCGIDLLQERYNHIPFDPGEAQQLMVGGLPHQLMKLMSRTMVLELNVARMQGLLKGDTPEARYLDFLESLTEPGAMLSILREYPVLSRHIVTTIDNWVETSLEFLERLTADWEMICARLNRGTDPGDLRAVAAAAGDLHRGGRSVVIATFGDGWKLVYKPHSMAVDVHFGELLAVLNQWGNHPQFRTPRVIDRPGYGWVEFIEARACETAEQLCRFYERQGGYLALLYFLEATDFHLENLIAAGEHPVMVDLEALFHPRMGLSDGQAPSDRLGAEVMARSVLRVGLLPQRIWTRDGKSGIDISGLGGEPGQLSPHMVPVFDGAGTDEMRVARKQVAMPGSHNRPTIAGNPVNPQEFVDHIVRGFASIYELVIRHRDELLAPNGRIAAFAADETRAVLRPTRTYALLLSEGCHPDVLRQGFEQDRLFDRLWMDISARPKLADLIPAESADLRRGDVPVFTTRPDSTDIWTSTGQRLASFFETPSLAAVRQRLEEADESDLERQIWFIRASMASLAVEHDGRGATGARGNVAGIQSAATDDIIAAAKKVGDKLDMLAIEQGDDVAWIGLVLVDGRSWSLLPLSFDLYGGTLGILLFLGYLGWVTGEQRYTSLARRAIASVLKRADSVEQPAQQVAIAGNIGAFSGWGGVIHTLAHMGALWGDGELISRAKRLTELIAKQIEQDRCLDIIGGAAGLMAVLCSFYRLTGFDPALRAARDCGDHLIAAARPMADGIAWETPVRATRPLTGLSHGAAGFAWALHELASLTGDQRFTRASLDAVAYERSVFSPEAANWPDFRSEGSESPGRAGFSMSWCHGAPGIALARLASIHHLSDPGIRSDAEIALDTTIRSGFGTNHSLCHGDLGNVEPVLIASQLLDDPRWKASASAIASSILKRFKAGGWICGVPQGVETPGLLVGLAGIGYGLLRLADPARIPSILTLAPPTICSNREQDA